MNRDHKMKMLTLLLILILFGLFMGCKSEAEPFVEVKMHGDELTLTLPSGRRIFFNIIQEDSLPEDLTEDDILLVSHDAFIDMYNPAITEPFAGPKLIAESGSLSFDDVEILSIPSKFGDDQIMKEKGGYFIYIIKVADLKIVHFGEMSQYSLSKSQKEAVDGADLAFYPLCNFYDDTYNYILNAGRMEMLAEVNAKILVPMMLNREALIKASERFNRPMNYLTPESSRLLLSKSIVPKKQLFLIMDELNSFVKAFGEELDMTPFKGYGSK